jgi:hypothetical protein
MQFVTPSAEHSIGAPGAAVQSFVPCSTSWDAPIKLFPMQTSDGEAAVSAGTTNWDAAFPRAAIEAFVESPQLVRISVMADAYSGAWRTTVSAKTVDFDRSAATLACDPLLRS